MTGVVKSAGKYALLAGTALALSISAASAASMAKAGMDKRVADLEREVTLLKNQMKAAMSAKPDTSGLVSSGAATKVSLSGWVNTAVRLASTPDESSFQTLDNSLSGSRFRIKASGALNKKTTASTNVELSVNGQSRGGTDYDDRKAAPAIGVRIVDASISHMDLGTVTLGHGWIAGSGGYSASFNGTNHVIFSIWGPSHDGLAATVDGKATGAKRNGVSSRAFGTRMSRIMYKTPSLMGLSIDTSYNNDKSWSVGASLSGLPSVKEIGLKLNGAYHAIPKTSGGDAAQTHFGVSAGMKHNASGLNVNGAFGSKKVKGGATSTDWIVDGGWSGKLIDAGATSLQIGYGKWATDKAGESTRYHFAVNQSVASASADLYMGVSYDTGTYKHTVKHDADSGAFDNACGAATGDDAGADDGPDSGATCEPDRDGVFIIVAGIRVKF